MGGCFAFGYDELCDSTGGRLDLVGLEVRMVGMREGLTFTRPFTIL